MARFGERTRSGTQITGWTKRPTAAAAAYGTATGGTSSTITVDGVSYTLLTFTSTGTLTVTKAGVFDVLLVGGGGTGGQWLCTSVGGGTGGGGGGGVLQTQITLSANATVTIGGGASRSNVATGSPTVVGALASFDMNNVAAIGGGSSYILDCGGDEFTAGGCGAGGYGASGGVAGGDGFQGGNGGNGANGAGGGGGGGSASGTAATTNNGGAGAAGKDISAFLGQVAGTTLIAGGGGGGGLSSGGAAGSGGGGAGSAGIGSNTNHGTANTGGGGGGGYNGTGAIQRYGNGGSGVAYIRFKA